jgi:hypothetical protein
MSAFHIVFFRSGRSGRPWIRDHGYSLCRMHTDWLVEEHGCGYVDVCPLVRTVA